MNTSTVTMAYLSRLNPQAAYDKLFSVVAHNLEAATRQIGHVASRPKLERLHRLSSDLLPGYTHSSCLEFYRDRDLRHLIESRLAAAGELAREHGVRLSMHPGQFCVIASANASAAENGIAEFEYHADVMRMMGYDGGWHPHGAHINIHGGAKAVGIDGIRQGLERLSETARNLITIENDEVSYGLDDLLPLADAVPLVLDLHHHWIKSEGEYVEPDDSRIATIIASWRDVRPLSHISVSREDLLAEHDTGVLPDFAALVKAGVKPKDLRGHSNLMWNLPLNDLVARHLAWTDFEVEAKHKNIASEGLARHVERFRA
ncbi:UV damage endonuclease UvsE [Microvirga sp. ACRRW]|uniref:UV damage endonuclease UvsE n=1 Tax=Microvirga sp. ACRRW TaxID=2918205 RepID=UPI001EF56D46|nr:UV damage endonuclease UvsE [Microvirga sp. ACRRW]MCG7391995.1 UV damage endonuclease UvsE [Microvirga sp. ACRRW]